jgi:hypothetical protein
MGAVTGEVLHLRHRKGSANTGRGAPRFVRELFGRVRRAGAHGQLTLRADSEFWSKHVVAAGCDHDVRYSITVRQTTRAIAAIAEEDWVDIDDVDEGGCAQVAECPYGDGHRPHPPHPTGRHPGGAVLLLAPPLLHLRPRRDGGRPRCQSPAPRASRGDILIRLYHESDLLVAEVCATGTSDGLDPAAVAAVVSTCSFESRHGQPRVHPAVPRAARHAIGQVVDLAEQGCSEP